MSAAVLLQDHDQTWTADIRAALSRKFANEARVTLQRAQPQYVANNVAQSLHQNSLASNAPNNGDESEAMRSPTKPRTSDELTVGPERTRSSLHRKFKLHFNGNAKSEARKIGKSPETVDLYRQVNIPEAWVGLAEACKANPHFALDILEDLGIDLDNDRESYALFLSLKNQMRGR